jgi:archaemetzincin
MKQGNITLISFGYFEYELLEKILNDVENEFSVQVRTKEGFLDLTEYYDPSRNQYDGNKLLKIIDLRFVSDNEKILGLFNVDLFIPILTFIFGQAYLNGRCGIVSVYRLKNERYGLIADEQVFLDRFRKEVIHELGHTFGLIHCLNPSCVMRSGTYVEDIDQKSHHLCMKCKWQLEL